MLFLQADQNMNTFHKQWIHEVFTESVVPFAYHKVFRKKPPFRKAAVLSKEHTTTTDKYSETTKHTTATETNTLKAPEHTEQYL